MRREQTQKFGKRHAQCECLYNFTCRYCLQNAPAYFFTPTTGSERISLDIWKKEKET